MRAKIAYFILRTGLGVVFLIFGIGKFRGDIWAQTMVAMDFFRNLPWSAAVSVTAVGALETVTGICLIIGLFTRFFALLAALQLTAILILLKFQEIRDVGLLGAALYIMMVKAREVTYVSKSE
ncbi:MAG: DoxX family protein [Candidatus Omnitrophica bacterium]|nr:DoxX family protein [Candidatus Omnitrophota bacterium]